MDGDPARSHKKREIFGRMKVAWKRRGKDRHRAPDGRELNTQGKGTAPDANSDRVNFGVNAEVPNSNVESTKTEDTKANDGDVKNYWHMAYDALSETDRNILAKHVPATTEPLETGRARTEEILVQVIKATESQYKENQRKDEIREKSQKILNCVLSFQDVVKSAVQFDPTGYASSAWGIVSLGLTMAKNHVTLRDALLGCSEYLADLLSRCAFIEEQFYHNSELGVRNGEKERSIVRIYVAVFKYIVAVRKAEQFGKGRKLVDSITSVATQQLEQLKTSIKEEESHMHHWLLLDEHLHRKTEADKLLAGVRQVHHAVTLLNLPVADGAFFDSFLDQHEDECLVGTRTDLLQEVREWGRSSDRRIFWLSGMAGTGKSTIARSVARSFQNDGVLGASFFFKRGDGDRGSASKLFPTIVKQLVAHIPQMIDGVQHALDDDPAITAKSLRMQFDKLILQPLLTVGQNYTATAAIIVIDALDECDREDDVELILELLPKVDEATNMKIRFFLTSRPESPIRYGFDQIDHTSFQNTILQNLDNDVIEHDIILYLRDEFSKIRAKRHRDLSPDWPGEERIKSLAQMAVPLFILAATVCRFVADRRFNPEKRLQQFSQDSPGSKMDKTYQPILNQLIVEDKDDANTLIGEFQKIIGVIISLAAPLSLSSLSDLLEIPESDISNQLDLFHSVLSIPTDPETPIRTLHLSFRDYLVHDHTRSQESTSPFWVDEKQKHEFIARKCLAIMNRHLKKNICELSSYGTLRTEIDQSSIARFLPPSLQYACHYWIHHLASTSYPEKMLELAFAFLEKHFLHWLESMSISGVMFEVINWVNLLIAVSEDNVNDNKWSFLIDARRFLRELTSIVDKAPLQLYSCGLLFTPENALIRRTFEADPPHWLSRPPIVDKDWSSVLQTLEGPKDGAMSISFPLGGLLLAAGFEDHSISLWNPTNGELLRTTVARFNDELEAISVAFSPDFQLIASGSSDKNISLWDPTNGDLRHTLKGHGDFVISLAFSGNGKLLASGSWDCTIRLWDPITGDLQHTLNGHEACVTSVAFSPNSQRPILASGSWDCTIRLWDPITGDLKHTLGGHEGAIISVAFSFDCECPVLASSSEDYTIRLWNPITGHHKHTLNGHLARVVTIAVSPIGNLLVSGSEDGTIKLWDTTNGELKHTIGSSVRAITSIAISPQRDSLVLASAYNDGTISLWDPTASDLERPPEAHSKRVVCAAFSPDGMLLASGSEDYTIKLWDVATGDVKHTLESHTARVNSVLFSPYSHLQLLASSSDDQTVKLWDSLTGRLRHTLEGHSRWVRPVAFSPDSKHPLIASGAQDYTLKLWDPLTGDLKHTLDCKGIYPTKVWFSTDLQRIVTPEMSFHNPELYHGVSDDLVIDQRVIDLSDQSDQTDQIDQTGDLMPDDEKYLRLDELDKRWITINGEREVWLPPDYEPSCSAVKGSTIAIGCTTGRVCIIEFSTLKSKLVS
ncbi:hypothetical protein N7540_004683 [Penicillium herquei]|nr:hypothetical protein N7540_004683 [Penicillium herquei]